MKLIDNGNDLVKFIDNLRHTDPYIETIYLNGGCYKFHLLLSTLVDECKPYINRDKNHVVTQFKGVFFDITGIAQNESYELLSGDDLETAKQWSFRKKNALKLCNCPNCEEPIIL